MKSLKIVLVGTLMFIVGLGIMSFQQNQMPNPEVKLDTWHYLGGSGEGQILDKDKWVRASDNGSPHLQCGNGFALPCTIPGPADPDEFQEYLDELGVDGVMDESTSKRP